MKANVGLTALTARFGLAAVALMASLPFLPLDHTTPIPSFHAEWLAAALGLAASLALTGASRMPLPGAALLALALAAIALLQTALGRTPVPQLTTLFVLYLLWSALLASTGSHLANVFGKRALANTLALAMLAGAAIVAFVGIFQSWLKHFGWAGFPAGYGGPLGQSNHFVSYLWLGVAAAIYLRTAAGLPRWAIWTLAALMLFAAVLAGQRSSFLYAAALIVIAALTGRNRGREEGRDSIRIALGVGTLFLLLQPAVMLLPSIGGANRPPPALRATQEFDRPSLRLQLWRLGAIGALDSPLLGNGIGSYPDLALFHADDILPADNPGTAEHAHNLAIDIAAELGMPAALLILLGGGMWLLRLPTRTAPHETIWVASAAAILGLHSMIEYPLWHSYFLGLLAVLAGGFGARREVGQRLAPLALSLGLVAWGSLALVQLERDYKLLESSLALGKQAATIPLAKALLLRIPQASLLSPWVGTTACVSLDPLQVPLADGLSVCKIAMQFAPTPESGVNMAVLQWRGGDTKGALDLLHQLKRTNNPSVIDQLLLSHIVQDERLKVIDGY